LSSSPDRHRRRIVIVIAGLDPAIPRGRHSRLSPLLDAYNPHFDPSEKTAPHPVRRRRLSEGSLRRAYWRAFS
jgi:hypothetical protein